MQQTVSRIRRTTCLAEDEALAEGLAEILLPGSQVKAIENPVIHMPNGQMFEVTVQKRRHKHRNDHLSKRRVHEPKYFDPMPADGPSHLTGGFMFDQQFDQSFDQQNSFFSIRTATMTSAAVHVSDDFESQFLAHAAQQEDRDVKKTSRFSSSLNPIVEERDQELDTWLRKESQYLGTDWADHMREKGPPGSPFGQETSDDTELDLMFDSLLSVRDQVIPLAPVVNHLTTAYDLLHQASVVNGTDLTTSGIKDMMCKRRKGEKSGKEWRESKKRSSGGGGRIRSAARAGDGLAGDGVTDLSRKMEQYLEPCYSPSRCKNQPLFL